MYIHLSIYVAYIEQTNQHCHHNSHFFSTNQVTDGLNFMLQVKDQLMKIIIQSHANYSLDQESEYCCE